MSTKTRIVEARVGTPIHLGRVGEHEATSVLFDITDWYRDYGEILSTGSIDLIFTMNGYASLHNLEWEPIIEKELVATDPHHGKEIYKLISCKLKWTVTDDVLFAPGRGKCELVYYKEGAENERVLVPEWLIEEIPHQVIKSDIYDTVVTVSLDYEDVPMAPPENQSSWIRELIEAADAIEDNIYDAQTYASEAVVSASAAAISATNAAVSESNASTSATNAATSASNAAASENTAQEHADSALASKNEAASSAGEASKSKTDAEKAVTVAETYSQRSEAAAAQAGLYMQAAAESEKNAGIYKEGTEYDLQQCIGLVEQAAQSAWQASQSSEHAQNASISAEHWATGTRGGQPVGPGTEGYQDNAKYYAERASGAAAVAEAANSEIEANKAAAEAAAKTANNSASMAAKSANSAEEKALLAQNSEEQAAHYSEISSAQAETARSASTEALEYKEEASKFAEDAEAWAVGTKKGSAVLSGESQYENNAKYWSDIAKQYSGNPAKPIEGTWHIWNANAQQYEDTGIRSVLAIVKSYPSINSMNADVSNMKEGDLVIIASDVDFDPDNSKLYVHNGSNWVYLSDLSGLQGVGIASIIKTSGNSEPGTIDVYTITLTDGRTSTISVYNGRDGEGIGDMLTEIYDPELKVRDAGGIVEYVKEYGTKVIIKTWTLEDV